MSGQNIWQLAKSDYLKLVPILGLAFYIAFIPNLDYPYPIHIDEWVHLAYSNAMLQSGSAMFTDPFFGEATTGFGFHMEAGFHVFWGVFKGISGISWLTIFRYFPSIIFMFTVLSVYILARREGYGWEAALLTCLIPTTVGIMGPAFLIPVAMGLPFIPLSLFIIFNCKTAWSYPVLFIFTLILMIVHAASAACLIIILVPYILLNLKGNFKHSLAIALALAVPFLMTLPWTYDLIMSTAKSLLAPQPLPAFHDLPRLIKIYGYLPIAATLIGTAVLSIKGSKKDYSLVLGLMALLLMLATFYTLHYGVSIIWLRGILFTLLMMSTVAGAGLMSLRKLELPGTTGIGLRKNLITQCIGILLCLVFIGATLTIAIPDRQDTPYYHMIGTADYDAFVWIRDNVDASYEKAILDPWKATAFTAITQRHVYTRIHTNPRAKDEKASAFLKNGCVDTNLLNENDITIVYSQEPCSNPDLVEVRKNVYLLKEAEGRQDL
jgi:hypothetical protein